MSINRHCQGSSLHRFLEPLRSQLQTTIVAFAGDIARRSATISRLCISSACVAGAPSPSRTASGGAVTAKASLATAPIPAERSRATNSPRVQGGVS